jgi:hypothetical protein
LREDWDQSEVDALKEFEDYEAFLVPLSGRGVSDKLDVGFKAGKLQRYRMSNKFTEAKSFSVSIKDWDKDLKQAAMMGCKLIRRVDVNGRKFIISEQDRFLELIQE